MLKVFELTVLLDNSFTLLLPLIILLTKNEQNKDVLN